MMIIGVVCLSNSLKAADWPQWRGPERNAHSDEHLTSTDWEKNPPKHLWTVSGFDKGFASVAIVKGTLYTLGNTDGGQAVIAAKADDGSILWKKVITDANPQHDLEGSRCTPSVDGDRVYVVTSNGSIACLKSDNGDVVWQRQLRVELVCGRDNQPRMNLRPQRLEIRIHSRKWTFEHSMTPINSTAATAI